MRRPTPARKLKAARSSGEIRLFSKEYLTKKATPRNNARPPIQAKSLTPMNCSQLIVEIASGARFAAVSDSGSYAGAQGIGGGAGNGGTIGSVASGASVVCSQRGSSGCTGSPGEVWEGAAAIGS